MPTLLWQEIERTHVRVAGQSSRLLIHLHVGHVIMIFDRPLGMRITSHDSCAEVWAKCGNEKGAALAKKESERKKSG